MSGYTNRATGVEELASTDGEFVLGNCSDTVVGATWLLTSFYMKSVGKILTLKLADPVGV